jgi:uncharacterized protein (UPF0332 family)
MSDASGSDVSLFLEKAEESLAGADSECANGRYNNCANRAYYPSFQAAIAALVRIGIGPSAHDKQWRHDAVQAQFSEQLINRRKLYPAALQSVLERCALLRSRADYKTQKVTGSQALRALRHSRELVEAVTRRGGPVS